ncbi:MAG: hypothetical protein GX802_07105 [Clostridiales bacterium]|jgi:hypothetical protein|nr:hypothetical protein [Clostridiales bacterium]
MKNQKLFGLIAIILIIMLCSACASEVDVSPAITDTQTEAPTNEPTEEPTQEPIIKPTTKVEIDYDKDLNGYGYEAEHTSDIAYAFAMPNEEVEFGNRKWILKIYNAYYGENETLTRTLELSMGETKIEIPTEYAWEAVSFSITDFGKEHWTTNLSTIHNCLIYITCGGTQSPIRTYVVRFVSSEKMQLDSVFEGNPSEFGKDTVVIRRHFYICGDASVYTEYKVIDFRHVQKSLEYKVAQGSDRTVLKDFEAYILKSNGKYAKGTIKEGSTIKLQKTDLDTRVYFETDSGDKGYFLFDFEFELINGIRANEIVECNYAG